MDNFDQEVDDLLENFELKPITKGLGFHHSLQEKKDITTNLKQQSTALQNELETRIGQLDTEQPENKAINMGELAPFYTSAETTSVIKPIEVALTKKKELLVEANSFKRAIAWLIDFTLITVLMAIALVSILFLADYPLNFIHAVMVNDVIIQSFLFIYLMFYIFYFSFFDMTAFSTPGKNMLKIKVLATNGKVSLTQSFMRTCLALGSIPMLGLPLMLHFQDLMTNTSVVEK
jgi:uncharacterized RDD family membrane protein YckC